MFIIKNNYYFIIESIKDIDLKKLKNFSKINIVYRYKNIEDIEKLKNFRKACLNKNIKFIVSNNIKLMILLKADGLYISAHNKNLNIVKYKHLNYKIIGGAHSIYEINLKKQQGCPGYNLRHNSVAKIQYIISMKLRSTPSPFFNVDFLCLTNFPTECNLSNFSYNSNFCHITSKIV